MCDIKNRVKYKNPFAMGNLSDLMFARENDDIEYLKEWSRKAVKAHEITKQIQLDAFERLIELKTNSSKSVEEIRQMLKDNYNSKKVGEKET